MEAFMTFFIRLFFLIALLGTTGIAMPAAQSQTDQVDGIPSLDGMTEEDLRQLFMGSQMGGQGMQNPLMAAQGQPRKPGDKVKNIASTLFFGFLHQYFTIVSHEQDTTQQAHDARLADFKRGAITPTRPKAPADLTAQGAWESNRSYANRSEVHRLENEMYEGQLRDYERRLVHYPEFRRQVDEARAQQHQLQRQTNLAYDIDVASAAQLRYASPQCYPQGVLQGEIDFKNDGATNKLINHRLTRFMGKNAGTLYRMSTIVQGALKAYNANKKKLAASGKNPVGLLAIPELPFAALSMIFIGLQLMSEGNSQYYYEQTLNDELGRVKGTLASTFFLRLAPAAVNYFQRHVGPGKNLQTDRAWVMEYLGAIDYATQQTFYAIQEQFVGKLGYRNLDAIKNYTAGIMRFELMSVCSQLVSVYARLHSSCFIAHVQSVVGPAESKAYLQHGSFDNYSDFARYKLIHYGVKSALGFMLAGAATQGESWIMRNVNWLGTQCKNLLEWCGVPEDVTEGAVQVGQALSAQFVPFYLFWSSGGRLIGREEDAGMAMGLALSGDAFSDANKKAFTYKIFENIADSAMHYLEHNHYGRWGVRHITGGRKIEHKSWSQEATSGGTIPYIGTTPRFNIPACVGISALWFTWWALYNNACQDKKVEDEMNQLGGDLFGDLPYPEAAAGNDIVSPVALKNSQDDAQLHQQAARRMIEQLEAEAEAEQRNLSSELVPA